MNSRRLMGRPQAEHRSLPQRYMCASQRIWPTDVRCGSFVSTPQQKCIGWPEQKYINDAGEQGPELGAFVRHQTWAGLSAGVSELARRERLLL